MSNQGSASEHRESYNFLSIPFITVIINTGLWTLRSLIVLSLFLFAPTLASAAPVISSVTVSNIGPTGATVTWTTNVPSTSQIEYGLTTSYGSRTIKDIKLVTAHSLPLVGLSPSALHNLRVLSDDSGRSAGTSGNNSFTTLAPVACAPAPTNSQVLNVTSYGATGNDTTDDTVAIQNAINAVVSGGTVLVPAGTYMMNTARIPSGQIALQLKSNMTFKMARGAVLKAMPSNSQSYRVINIQGVSNVSVIGGTVLGERSQHTGTGGEWGMGISIYSGQNIAIDGVTAKDLWGDGFYINQTGATSKSTGITFCNVVADNNRRQGMSIIWVDGMVVRDSVFKNTNGVAPRAGIDLEPNAGTNTNNVTITGSQFLDNSGAGVLLFANAGPVTNTTISNNFIRQKDIGVWAVGVRSPLTVSGNIIVAATTQKLDGIRLDRSLNNIISNNSISNSGTDGIRMQGDSDSNTITGNFIEGSSQNSNGAYSNIALSDSGTQSSSNIIKCNVLRPGALANKPKYGINVMTSSVTNTQLLTNNIVAGTSGTINNSGTGTVTSTDPANCPSAPPPPPPPTSCTQTPLNVSSAISDGGYSYMVSKTFGIPADTITWQTQSILRLFENGVEVGPVHALHADIRNLGAGRFSHWSDGAGESLRFSASNNSDPRTNGRSYAYCTPAAPSPTPDTTPPTVPTGLTAVASASQVSLSWNASTDNVGVTGYRVYRNGTQIAAPASSSYTDGNLVPGTYGYTVAAVDAAGNVSAQSGSVSATITSPFLPPGRLRLSLNSPVSRYQVAWRHAQSAHRRSSPVRGGPPRS